MSRSGNIDSLRRGGLQEGAAQHARMTPADPIVTVEVSGAAYDLIATAGGPHGDAQECLREAQRHGGRAVLTCTREAAIEIRDWFLGAARLAMRERDVERGGTCAAAAVAIERALGAEAG